MLQRYSNSMSPEAAEEESGFNLGEILSFLWRQWKFIGAFVIVSFLVAVVWLAKETPRYTASALVLLDSTREKAAGVDAILSEAAVSTTMIESQIAIINSTTFMRRVVEKERLFSDPEFGSGAGGKGGGIPLLESIKSLFGGGAPEPAPAVPAQPVNLTGSIEALKGATTVNASRGFTLVISVTSNDPTRAARLANAVADAYVVDKLESRFEAAKRASTWLNERLADLRKQLRASEEAVATFRAERGISQNSNITLTQQQLSDLNARLITARAETADKKARVDLFQSGSRGGQAQNVPDAANSALAGSLREQSSAVARKLADLRARYSDNHPLVVNAQAELRDIQRAIATETQRAVSNMKNEYELAKARQDSLEQTLDDVTGQSGGDNDTMITLRELERTAAVNKSLFEDFLQRSKVTQEQATFEPQQARVITPALTPGGPSYPNKNRTLMMALIIGLGLGVGGAYAKEMLNAGFTTPKQIEDMLELPLLASVSRMEARQLLVDGKAIPIPLFPAVKPLSRYSEAMRSLKNGIQMADVDNPPTVIQFTSSVPSEGKTTVGLSFVTSLATSGLKVLYIDADMRHPSGSKFLNIQNETGLVDILLGQVAPQDAIRHREDGRFWVLGAGSKTQNPPDLLSSDRMKALVGGLRKSFDYVVIDTPPVGPVIDPVIVSRLVDKIVFVVRWADTSRELVRNSIQQLSGHKKVAGVVFNHVHEGEARKYGKYAYSYYYGSRYYKNYYSE
jgi:succinoglycan biosynthesis transport protein ExoP